VGRARRAVPPKRSQPARAARGVRGPVGLRTPGPSASPGAGNRRSLVEPDEVASHLRRAGRGYGPGRGRVKTAPIHPRWEPGEAVSRL